MDTHPEIETGTDTATPDGSATRMPVLFLRRGRGRTGGSTACDWVVQRARRLGRRVKPLDGDRRSATLSSLYPARDRNGEAALDPASSPQSEELPDIRQWLSDELDAMVGDRVSRVLDLGGGDRVIQEFVRDLPLEDFSQQAGIRVVQAFFLGPDMEDFNHVQQILKGAEFMPGSTVMFLNEGVIRHGETTTGAFKPIMSRPDFRYLVDLGIRAVMMRRLLCLSLFRDRKLSINDVLDQVPDAHGRPASPTQLYMTKKWLMELEKELSVENVAELLP